VSPSLMVHIGAAFIEYPVIDEEACLVWTCRECKSAPMCYRTRPHDIDVERFIHVLSLDRGLGCPNICGRSLLILRYPNQSQGAVAGARQI
jgi:hypothetical protein